MWKVGAAAGNLRNDSPKLRPVAPETLPLWSGRARRQQA